MLHMFCYSLASEMFILACEILPIERFTAQIFVETHRVNIWTFQSLNPLYIVYLEEDGLHPTGGDRKRRLSSLNNVG